MLHTRFAGNRALPVFVSLLVVTAVGTQHAAHAATYVVSPAGNDDHPGTPAKPFQTISQAAKVALPGDTVLVRAGVYRERVAPPRGGEPDKPIIYRGEKLGKVFIKGSNLWAPDWKKYNEGVYFAVPDPALFDDDVYLDSGNPFRVGLASTPYGRNGKPEKERFDYGNADLVYTCGQVFVDGKPLTQVPFLDEVEQEQNTWTYQPETGRIYIHFVGVDPSQQKVEISTRRRIFAPHALGLGHIVVEGFVFEHCGNQYPTNFWNTPVWGQAGALGFRGGHHWIVRNNVIRYANTVAIDIGADGGDNERESPGDPNHPLAGCDNLIEANYLIDNGAAGLIGSGSTRMTIRDNVILRNNTLQFTGNKRYEHAGIKCHNIKDGLIEHNYVAGNPKNNGVWLDNRFPGTRITRNVIVNNGVKGIFLEMSDYDWDSVLVDHNIVVGNEAIQFYVHDASGSTVMHNLFANSPAESRFGQGAYIYQVTTRTRTYHHSLYNNLFVHHKSMIDINYPSHRGGPQRLDHNVYDASANDRVFCVNSAADKPSPWKPDQFIDLIHRELGTDSPGREAIAGDRRATLTLAEWQTFWSKHDLKNDRHSVLQQGMSVAYDSETCQLTVVIPFEPRTVGSTDHKAMDVGFWRTPVPQDGHAKPGPFQNLKKGENTLHIWDGLPILKAGSLPVAD